MIANGDTPLCVGIESGPATGWPFTDWVEELILREQGIDYYNQWVAHEVPFNDQPVVDTFNEVAGPDGLWTKEGAVFASGGSIAATAFGDNGTPLVEGNCMMHRQASFYSAFFPEGTEFGEGPGQVSTFYFPADEGHPVLVGGISAGAFRDAPEVWQVMEYLGSAEFANARQAAQSERVGGGTLRVPHGEHERRPEPVEPSSSRASSRSSRPPTRRRSTPPTNARRGRVGHVLDRGHVVRQRRRGRRGGRPTTSRAPGRADRLTDGRIERSHGGAGGARDQRSPAPSRFHLMSIRTDRRRGCSMAVAEDTGAPRAGRAVGADPQAGA